MVNKLPLSAALLACVALQAATHQGIVRSGGLPIPGAAVTATRPGHSVTVFTAEDGSYLFPDLAPGAWKIEVSMPGFETAEREIVAGSGGAPLEILLALKPPPSTAAAAAPAAPSPAAIREAMARRRAQAGERQAAGSGSTGFQQLAVSETAAVEIATALEAPAPEPDFASLSQNANESFLLTGSLSRGLQEVQREDPFSMNRDEFRQRVESLRAAGMLPLGMGEEGGFPGGPMAGGPGMDGPPIGGPGMGPPGMGGPGMGGPPGGGPAPGARGPGGGTAMSGGPRGAPGMMGGGGPGGGPGSRGGGFSGRRPGSGPPMREMAFGNRLGRARDAVRGGASLSLRNSALDARPYSLSGQDLRKPSYAQTRFSLMLGGTLNIPKIVRDDRTFFFLNYGGARSRNPFDAISTLPSPLERAGDFSQSGPAGAGVLIADPRGRLPFAGGVVPASRLNPAAREMLSLFPLPNLPGAVRNYQILTSLPSGNDNLGLRLGRSFSRKDRLSGSFNLQQRNLEDVQLFGFRDSSAGRGQRSDLTWTHTFRQGFLSNLRASFSRNTSEMTPYFAFGRDWARELGIQGTPSDPRTYGPPNLSFTNFGGLTGASPSRRADQTASLSESLLLVRRQHNLSFGGEYRRSTTNTLTYQNARGAYTFSGVATSLYDQRGFPLAGTGFDFADYLLGLPQSSNIRFGNPDIYFRGAAYSLFLQDDWRVRGNFSVNAGLRYEYVQPRYELYGRMANLDVAPGFTAVAVVTPGAEGPYTGRFPKGLIDPDPNNLAPRIGIAWRPLPKRRLQVRAGYGWYFNASVTAQAANRLAQQPPFARSGSLVTSLANPLTIETGFARIPAGQVTNTYAVDRFYRTGYAQTWNLSIQQDLPHSLVMEIGYLGTKGTRLDTQRWPNRTPPGSPLAAAEQRTGNATGFTFDSSEANSIFHSGQLRLSRRFRGGIAAGASYTYGKSIDNASSIGGGGAVVAQDDQNLRAERGLSSFDRRHSLNLSYVLSTATGRRGGSVLDRGFASGLLKNWTLTGGVTIRSGGPFTAQVLGNRSDLGGAGTIGSGRADATGAPVRAGTGYFNLAAFTLPPAGRYGNAARNTIPGPGFFAMNGSFGRTLFLGERRALDLRLEANNLLNSVNIARIGTTVNATNYGLALGASAMRSMSISLRMRF